MKKYFVFYEASYGPTCEYIGEFNSEKEAEKSLQNKEIKYFVCDESDFRGLYGSMLNVLMKI